MSTTAYAWAPITKVEDQDDGTVMVYGPVADAGVDRDKQRLNQEWLDSAMPTWMAEGGNVREQHDTKRAVGVGVGLTRVEDGTHMLAAAVVDPVAVAKVKPLLNEDGTVKRPPVLKGFSVGIKEPQIAFGKADAPNGEVIGGSIIEVSLVDRPSNPRTLFTMVKADGDGELEEVEEPEVEEDDELDDEAAKTETVAPMFGPDLVKFVSAASRRRMADSGVAMSNGDFPIPDEGHLRSAVGHLGNYTGDRVAARAHIIARARALGLEKLLPQDWGVEKADGVLAELARMAPSLTKAAKADPGTDIATAQQAIALIAELIRREATSLAGGALDEDGDIACLLDATRALKYFIACEEQEMEPSTEKVDKVDTLEVAKTETPDLAAIVKAAVAEATTPLKDELTLVKADVAKALALPEPGGPVGMRTASQVAAARGVDAASLRAQAAELLAKAEAVRRDDPTAAAGYRERATDLLAKADA